MSKNLMFSLLGQGNVIPVHREVVRLLGSYEAAALLEQLTYWMPRAQDPDGYVHKTREEWMEELVLSEHQFKAARARLEKLELLETRMVRVQRGQTHINLPAFRVNLETLATLLQPLSPAPVADPTPEVSPTRGGENHRLEVEVFSEAEVVKITDSLRKQNLHTEPTNRTKEGEGGQEGSCTVALPPPPPTPPPGPFSGLEVLKCIVPPSALERLVTKLGVATLERWEREYTPEFLRLAWRLAPGNPKGKPATFAFQGWLEHEQNWPWPEELRAQWDKPTEAVQAASTSPPGVALGAAYTVFKPVSDDELPKWGEM